MSIGTYYFNGTSFSNATAVYTNASLTTLAPDGFYSDAGIVRQQLNGVLLNVQTCNSCAVDCGSGVSGASNNQNGVFQASVDLANSTGAVIFYGFWGASIPDGCRLVFNNQTVNRFTCFENHSNNPIVNGAGTTVDYAGINNAAGEYTYLGSTNNQILPNSPYNGVGVNCPTQGGQPEDYTLINGTYVAQGSFQNITVTSDMLGVNSTSNLLAYTAVVPKTVLTPTVLQVQISAPLCGTLFNWTIACPVALPSFQASPLQGNTNCATATSTFYYAKNATWNGSTFTPETGSVPVVGNFVFTDADGTTYLNDTNNLQYIILANNTALGIRNGVVVSTATCVIP